MNRLSRSLFATVALCAGLSQVACDRRPSDPQPPSEPALTTPMPSTRTPDSMPGTPPMPPASAASQ